MDDQKKKKIETAMALMAQIITDRDDGRKYIPIYDRLSAELTAMSSKSQRLEEIRKIAMRQRNAA